jgi:hypothetical protein
LPFIDRDEFGIPLIIAGVKLTDIVSETRANFVRSGRRMCSVADVCCLSFSYVRFVPINIAGKDTPFENVPFTSLWRRGELRERSEIRQSRLTCILMLPQQLSEREVPEILPGHMRLQ